MSPDPDLTVTFSRVSLGRLRKLIPPRVSATDYIPQANDLGKVFELVWSLENESLTAAQIADRFEIVPRQGAYYVEAARELGFLAEGKGNSLRPTRDAVGLKSAEEPEALSTFARHVLLVPVIRSALELILSSPDDQIRSESIRRVVRTASRGRYSSSTVKRRTECVIAWLRWLENNSEFVV